MRKSACLITMIGCLSALPIASASVLFSEIAANPPGSDDGREWIEFYAAEETNLLEAGLPNTSNSTSSKVTGWLLVENDVQHRLSLVNGNETVPAHSYFVVADDAARFVNETGYNGTLFDSSFSLRNTGETLIFGNGTYNDTLTYNETPEGKTFCLINNMWSACEPTPGYANRLVVLQNSSNTTANVSVSDSVAEDALRIVSYPRKLRFGSSSYISVYVATDARAYVYAYGYPKQVLADENGNGVHAGDYNGGMSAVAEGGGGVLVPVRVKNNCDGEYDDGSYRVRVRVADSGGREIETEDVLFDLYGRGECEEVVKEQAPINVVALPEPRVFIADVPVRATVGQNITVRVVVVGSGSFDVYSYARNGRALASSGSMKDNVRTMEVDEIAYVELQNTLKREGNITFYVKADAENKTYETRRQIVVEDARTAEGREVETMNSTAVPKSIYLLEKPRVVEKKTAWDAFIDRLRKMLR